MVEQCADIETLAAVIARSPIVVKRRWARTSTLRLPEGYEDADLAILDWIAAEGRCAGRWLLRI
jgi:hypothetical protein